MQGDAEEPVQSKVPLLVWGTGGHALIVSDILRLMGCYEIVGYIDDFLVHGNAHPLGTILGGRQQIDAQIARGVRHISIAVGDCAARLMLAAYASAKGLIPVTAIHPRAIVADSAVVGAGSVIVAGAVVNPGARLGEHVIVNTGATIEHECVIEAGAHVSAGVNLGGKTTIGRAAWVCIGATVIDRVTIGAGAIVGAGSLVLTDIPANVLAYGVPARPVRTLSGSAATDLGLTELAGCTI